MVNILLNKNAGQNIEQVFQISSKDLEPPLSWDSDFPSYSKEPSSYKPDFATSFRLVNKLLFRIVFKVTNKLHKISEKIQKTYVNASRSGAFWYVKCIFSETFE